MEQNKTDKQAIFISYSHHDEEWANRLSKHLQKMVFLKGKNNIELSTLVWDDRKIMPGQKWQEEIQNAIESSSIAVLLLSPSFLSSDYIIKHELPSLLRKSKEKDIKVIPITVEPINKALLGELENYQILNINQPLSTLSKTQQEEAFLNAIKEINSIILSSTTCFIITPMLDEFKQIRSILVGVLQKLKIQPILLEEIPESGRSIGEKVQNEIRNADFLVVDITGNNPNVFFELGFAYASKKPILLLVQDDKTIHIPSDISLNLIITYNLSNNLTKLEQDLSIWISSIIKQIGKGGK
jgi:predicted nucleotide-binding protein